MSAELVYPLERVPAAGEAVEIADGVHWARLHVPGALRHINVWLLEDGDGWTLVDTGLNVETSRAAWDGPLGAYLRGRPLARIVCTHHHPDHAGLADALAERYGVEVWMTAAEQAVLRRLARMHEDRTQDAARLAAATAEGLEVTAELRRLLSFDGYFSVMSGVPARIRTVAAGEVVAIGARRFTAHVLGGHTDGQLVLVDAGGDLMISGDQVLPRITSNVGVYAGYLDQDPVATYLASLDALSSLGVDPLVLPSHGNPFRPLEARLAQLREHHARTLDRLLGLMAEPRTTAELSTALFPRAADGLNRMLAHAETLAHVRRLVNERRAERLAAPAGPNRYRRVA